MSNAPWLDNRKFDLTSEGFLEAKSYLKSIGEWENVSTTGFSVDGYSITDAANYFWWKNCCKQCKERSRK